MTAAFWHCSRMTRKPCFRSINSSSTVQEHVESTPESGLGPLQRPGASSKPRHVFSLFLLTLTRALCNEYDDAGLKVYITGDSADVYEDDFFKVAKSADGKFTPTLILVGIRLGIDRVTPVYWEALKSSLQMSQSMGIAGFVFLRKQSAFVANYS
jgi:hypothetical protein